MKILILGGTGVISSQIVGQALARDFDVTVFNRGTKPSQQDGRVKVINGDRKNAEDFALKMQDVEVDTVIDMISFNADDVRQTVEVFKDKAKQIIVTSSIAAYARPYKSYPVSEDCESLSLSPDFAYGFNKAEMERYLHSQMGKHPCAITVIRPSLTFWEGSANFGILRQNRNVVRRIKEGKPVVMVGEGVVPWSFTFAPDLAKAYVLACGNTKTYNDCFHITNTEIVMWEDFYRAVGKAVGKEPDMVYISSVLLRKMYPQVCEHLNFEKVHFSVFSNEKFQQAAPEYQPSVGLDEGIARLVEWWEKNDFPYDNDKDDIEDKICHAYRKFEQELMDLGLNK